MLRALGVAFEVMPSNLAEGYHDGEEPAKAAWRLAAEKAWEVAERFPERLVLAADTLVVVNGQMLGKPRDLQEARQMLKQLRGRCHEVITGFCLVNRAKGRVIKDVVRSQVKIKAFSSEQLEDYLKSGEPLDKAGAYAIQGLGSFLVEWVRGSYTNVVGLPLAEVRKALRDMGLGAGEG